MSDRLAQFAVESEGILQTVVVMRPNATTLQRADRVYRRARQKSVSQGDLTHAAYIRLIKQGVIWTPAQSKKLNELEAALASDSDLLARPDITTDEGIAVAERMKKNRAALLLLKKDTTELSSATADAKGGQAMFDFLVVECTVLQGKTVKAFKNVAEYKQRYAEDDPIARKASWAVAEGVYGLDEHYERHLPENAYLGRVKVTAECAEQGTVIVPAA